MQPCMSAVRVCVRCCTTASLGDVPERKSFSDTDKTSTAASEVREFPRRQYLYQAEQQTHELDSGVIFEAC